MSIRHERGIGLVELMIGMVLALVLVAGVLQIYLSTRDAYRMQDAVMRRQENLRFATHVLTQDLRAAGYRGCVRDTGNVMNTLNTPTAFLYNFAIALQGFEATGVVGTPTWAPTLDPSVTGVVPGTDVLTVRSTHDREVVTNASMPNVSADIKTVNPTPYPFAIGDIILISDCAAAAIFQITNLSTSGVNGNIVHNTGAPPPYPGNATKILNPTRPFPAGSQLQRIGTTSYYLSDSASGSGPALWRRSGLNPAEELVEGIENMQLLFGEDTDGDQSPNAWRKANAVTDWRNVSAVQVALLVRSADGPAGEPDNRQFVLLDETVGPFNDRRVRRVVMTTVSLRNKLP